MGTPLIAVAGFVLQRKTPEPHDVLTIQKRYVDAITRAGGLAVVVGYDNAAILDHASAVVLTGGGDVSPALYGQPRDERTDGIDPERDEAEIALALAAVTRRTPTLAICRGAQVLNVALGGSLVQHLPLDDHRESPGVPRPHEIDAEPGSRIAGICGTRFVAASSHHQAMDKVADGLLVTARSAHDAVIEGAEMDEGWVVAVQWHPERTAADDPAQQALFDALVRQASA